MPLAPHTVSEDFLASLERVNGVSRHKVVDVVVDVLTGRVHDLDGRESHQLRMSEGANSPYVTRPDGSSCWRIALQRNTPQATRRPRYEVAARELPDGAGEPVLCTVGERHAATDDEQPHRGTRNACSGDHPVTRAGVERAASVCRVAGLLGVAAPWGGVPW